MNYKIHLQVLGVVLGFLAVDVSRAAVVLVDNFNEYNGGLSVINNTPTVANASQVNPGGASGVAGVWTRFGAGLADGIYSIDTPSVSGRAAQFDLNWAGGNNGTIRYNFSTAQDLSLLTAVEIDLSLNTSASFPNTMVNMQISNGTTTWQLTTPLSITNTGYATFSFDVTNAANLTRSAGTASFATTLDSVTTVSFRFTNSVQTSGSQRVYFDNLNLVTVPEPSTAAAVGLAGLLLAGNRFARRRDS